MDQTLFPELSGIQLTEMLEANANGIEEMDFAVKLDKNEIMEAKTNFAQKSIEEARLLDELAEVKEEYKTKLKPIKQVKDSLLQEIKTGTRQEFGRCYKMVDYDSKEVAYYNNRGQLVYSRPAMGDEAMQLKIVSMKKAQ